MTANTKTIEEAEIRALIDNWANALRAKDANGVASQYATDSVKFILAPPLQYTRDNPFGKKGLEQWFSSFQGPIGYEIRELNIIMGDDVAFCHSLNPHDGNNDRRTESGLVVSRDPRLPQNRRQVDDHT